MQWGHGGKSKAAPRFTLALARGTPYTNCDRLSRPTASMACEIRCLCLAGRRVAVVYGDGRHGAGQHEDNLLLILGTIGDHCAVCINFDCKFNSVPADLKQIHLEDD